MTAALIVAAILNAFTALVDYVNNSPLLCCFNAIVAIGLIVAAIVKEQHILNRIKKLEEEIDILKRR